MFKIIIIGMLFGGNAPVIDHIQTREACSLLAQRMNDQQIYGPSIKAVCKKMDYHKSGAALW